MARCFGCRKYQDKVGVLVAQLGTPDAPTPKALRPYLREFLSDRRVIEVPRLLWWFILNFVVLVTRPKRSAANYARIWTDEGSPLLRITKSQTEKLARRLRAQNPEIETEFGMRYGSDSIESALEKLIEKGCTQIVLLPMYPQYAAPTSASVYDAFFGSLLKRRWVPTVKVAEPFFRHPLYIDAVRETIEKSYSEAAIRPQRLVLSYHGMPAAYIRKGDPYCCMCFDTTRQLLETVSIPSNEVVHTYQSRFGREPWLTPYTDDSIDDLAKEGIKHVAVACPGFVADCLETLDEIGNEAAHQFEKRGGAKLTVVPCVNDNDRFIECLEAVVLDTAGSWLAADRKASQSCDAQSCPARIGDVAA